MNIFENMLDNIEVNIEGNNGNNDPLLNLDLRNTNSYFKHINSLYN